MKQRRIQHILGLWRLARPLQLLAFLVLFTTGVLVAMDAGYKVRNHQLIWAVVPLLFGGASIHYSNEYADFETDRLTIRTAFSGGSGVLSSGLLSRQIAFVGMWLLLIITLFIAGIGVASHNLNTTAFVILSLGLVGGWMYSLAPLRLAWRGWGEVDNALLGGILLALYGYTVVSGIMVRDVILMFLPFTGIVFVNLLATTWTDRIADKTVGKLTLATRLSVTTLRRLYMLVIVMSYLSLVVLREDVIPIEIVVGALLISPIVIWAYVNYTRIESPHPTVYAMMSFMLVYFLGTIAQL